MARPGFDDPQWYQRAVFYEVFLRGFSDSSGDGTGDLRGLTERLDHLDWLGVDCVWLLPFYASPLRDGGYDISDFFAVHPTYGVLADVVELVDEAHKRGIRVVADLVLEPHQRPAPVVPGEPPGPAPTPRPTGTSGTTTTSAGPRPGSSSTTPSAPTGPGTRVREQYYWHRFFSHQPDLNYRNPEVRQAVLDMVRYWARPRPRRLPARRRARTSTRPTAPTARTSPRPTSSCRRCAPSWTPATPAACCWPRPTSGRATCCPTSAGATRATCASTSRSCPACTWPPSGASGGRSRRSWPRPRSCPTGCQWGLFLRNHDELTLEMVTDAERDEMYAEYAADPMMRRNSGIGRRLAPLLHNSRPADGAVLLAAASRCRAAPSSTTATRSAWATTSTSATATACGRRCSGRGDRNAGFSQAAPRGALPARSSAIRSTATRPSTSSRSGRTAARCCAG